MSLNFLDGDPKSYATSVSGIKSPETTPLKILEDPLPVPPSAGIQI